MKPLLLVGIVLFLLSFSFVMADEYNFTQLNDTITAAINTPTSYDEALIFLVAYILLLLLGLFIRAKYYTAGLAIYGLFYGIYLLTTSLWWLGTIVWGITIIIGFSAVSSKT